MNNELLQFKIKERLNKLDSKDFSNIDCFRITEAFNTYQLQWARESIKKGEMDKQLIEDLQPILKDKELLGTNTATYFESELLPSDYVSTSLISVHANRGSCKEDTVKVTLIEHGNSDEFLKEYVLSPSFEWRETFYSINANRFRVYTNGEFSISKIKLSYYRYPKPISIEGCQNEYGQGVIGSECEFKDDVTDLLIKGTCSIIAGDIENTLQLQRNLQPN